MSRTGRSQFLAGVLVGIFLATAVFAVVHRKMAARDGVKVLKLGHGLDQSHPVHLAMEYMNERLIEKSGGALRVDIYPNGQLGSETECIELCRKGSLAMTKTSAAPLEGFVPEMAVFGVPYVFDDAEHYWRVLDGDVGAELLGAGERIGLHGLCYYDAGARSFYTVDRPILEPSDLDGLKIRVMESSTAIKMVNALGAAPTAMNFGELYSALQQSMVDGAENNPPSFYSNRHYEVCKEYSLDEHTRVPDLLLISKKWWDRLSPDEQAWLEESARESSARQRELWKTRTADALAAVQEEGVTVHRPEKAPFEAKVNAMHEEYAGTPVGALLQRIKDEQ